MKEEIFARLNKIKNLDDRLTLKNVLADVFLNLYDKSENMYQTLEERVFAELMPTPGSYDIYTTVSRREDIDPVHYFLRPMQREDLLEKEYILINMINDLNSPEKKPLLKIFFECGYPTLKEIIASDKIFSGSIITETGRIPAKFKLKPNKSYLAQIEKIYQTFQNNGILWKTVNCPYIFRFLDVFMESFGGDIGEEAVTGVEIDFAEYNRYARYDMVPLWNIEALTLRSVGFPMPVKDKINFEHTVLLDDMGLEDGYLAVFEEEEVSYVRRTKQTLTIVAPTEQRDTWDILRIISPQKSAGINKYPLVSNAKRQTFSNFMVQKNQRVIKTQAEIRRLANSFSAAPDIILSHLEVIPGKSYQNFGQSQTYDMNYFIIDEIRRLDYQNKLILYFKSNNKVNSDLLIYDQMSFITSEIQFHYPEYKCEGVIL